MAVLILGQDYWAQHDESGEYPHELHAALSKDGWIGIALPEELGGSGLGISEATMMLQTISEYVLCKLRVTVFWDRQTPIELAIDTLVEAARAWQVHNQFMQTYMLPSQ